MDGIAQQRVVALDIVVVVVDVVGGKSGQRTQRNDPLGHLRNGGMFDNLLVVKRSPGRSRQQQSFRCDARIARGIDHLQLQGRDVGRRLGIEDHIVQFRAVGFGHEERIALIDQQLAVRFGRRKRRDNRGRSRGIQRVGGERIAVQVVGSYRGNHAVEVGFEGRIARKLRLARGVVHLVEHPGPLFVHRDHVLGVKAREVVGIRQRHDVQRVGQAAHVVLFARGGGRRIIEPGIGQEMFALLVFAQRSRILRPEGRILI